MFALFASVNTAIYAQTTDAKRELAAKVVALQQGPEMDRLLKQLAGAATQPLLVNWNPRLEQLPAAKQQSAVTALDAELKKFNEDALKLVTAQVDKIGREVLTPAYTEKFTEDELKQLVAMLDAPIFKKYQTISPEMGNMLVRGLVDATRADITERSKAFDAAASKIVGSAPASAPAAPQKKKP